MRTLILEDDPALLAILEGKLKPFGECHTVKDRDSALKAFREALNDDKPFDLVAIDMDMPETHAGRIISSIRAAEAEMVDKPIHKACLIAISNHKNRQLITDCMVQGCNDFLTKKRLDDQLLDIVAHLGLTGQPMAIAPNVAEAFHGARLVDYITRKIKVGDLKLPPAPRIAMRIRQLVGAGAEINECVELLRYDLSIATKLISISNSVAYGSVTKNTDIGQAVSRLGLDRTAEVVMSICCRGYFITGHLAYMQRVENLWWHSLACAHATEMVVTEKGLTVDEDLFSLALLHNIGKLVLIQAAADLNKPGRRQFDVNFSELEAILNEHHATVGSSLLHKWGYDKSFCAVIRQQAAKDDKTASTAIQVLQEADLLAAAAGFVDGIQAPQPIVEKLEALRYTAEQISGISSRIASRIEELRYLFG